jgi:hypothetical protein
MASKYRGVIRIGDKASGKATDVEVVDLSGNRLSLKLIDYVNSGAEPPYSTLPWQEDCQLTPAPPKQS